MRSNRFRVSVAALVLGISLLLAGCLPFPLGNPENSTVDSKLAGYWFAQDEDRQTLITLYPFDAHTYVLHAAEFKKDGDKFQALDLQLYKAWLTSVKGATFITLEPLSQHLPNMQDEKRAYLVARLIREGDGLSVKGVDADFEPMKTVKSAADVARVIADNLENQKLYSENPTHYRHLDAEKDADTLKPLIQLFK
jgi:hypothetical protein